jgi:hypothetical protein
MAAPSGVPACPSPRADPARVLGCQLVRLVSRALSLDPLIDLPMPTHHHIGQFGRLGDVHGRSGVHDSRVIKKAKDPSEGSSELAFRRFLNPA